MTPGNEAAIREMRSDWNRRARENAFYYTGFAGWEQSLETFLASGYPHVRTIESEISRLPQENAGNFAALEIGCGPGRLMAAMRRHFRELHGVDVSEEMIGLARQILQDAPNVHLHVNSGTDLRMFPGDCFDFVYSYAVFQHIPSKEVVLEYLRETRRVLKPGGVFRAQFDSLQESAPANTWSGCSFSAAEIADFADANGFALLAMTGEGSHYLWVTMRKIERPSSEIHRELALLAVSSPDGAPSVPQRGPGAAVSLWIAGATEADSLTDFTIAFKGRSQPGCYLSPIGPGRGCFINVLVPKNIEPGPARVTLTYRGKAIGEREIEVIQVPRTPRILSITDSVDKLMDSRIVCGRFRAVLEDVTDPRDVCFYIGDLEAPLLDAQSVDPVFDQYCFTAAVPGEIQKGSYGMRIVVSGLELAATVEIA
jgi:SAM-dependent methyltransferase